MLTVRADRPGGLNEPLTKDAKRQDDPRKRLIARPDGPGKHRCHSPQTVHTTSEALEVRL